MMHERVTDEEFVQALYEAVLGRPPDRDGQAALLVNLARGADPREVLIRFLKGDEYAARLRFGGSSTGASTAFALVHQPAILDLLAYLAQHDAVGLGKVRLGRDGDGGYVMLDDFAGLTAAYSFGIGDDVSWDKAIASLGLDVFQYDHSIPALPETDARFRWQRRRLVGSPTDDPSSITLAGALSENGRAARGDCILKVDVEGAEWEAFAAIEPDVLRSFRQIVCELHGLGDAADPARRARMRRALLALTANHRVVHVHGNNHAPWALIGGFAVPDVLEVTLARADGRSFARPVRPYPTPLDRPNDPDRADFRLGYFCFDDPGGSTSS